MLDYFIWSTPILLILIGVYLADKYDKRKDYDYKDGKD